MKVARSIERRLEGMVEGFFAKVFRSGLQPVEVGRRILREMDEGRTVSVNRTYAPNEFRIFMGEEDHERFSQMESGLVREFSEIVIEQAKQERWNLMGMPRITFVETEEMGKGEFKVEASLTADPDGPAPNVMTRASGGERSRRHGRDLVGHRSQSRARAGSGPTRGSRRNEARTRSGSPSPARRSSSDGNRQTTWSFGSKRQQTARGIDPEERKLDIDRPRIDEWHNG